MPADESELTIGGAWTLSYYAIMEDGRKVLSAGKTTISVANFFAGAYISHVIYHHPTYGVYPNDVYVDANYPKTLVATNANTCMTYMSIWADTPMAITIYANYS